jgi:membrane-associated phospholipid phosphatase
MWFDTRRVVAAVSMGAVAIPGILAGALSPTARAHPMAAGAVLAWNQIAVRTDLAAKQTNQEGVLHLAYVQAAVFDAVDAVDGGYRPYVGHLHAHGETDGDAAVAAAAHRVLVTQFADQAAELDADYAAALAAIPDGPAKARGVALGERAATGLLQARASDGFEATVPYTFGSGPGVWILPTDNPLTTPATPWVAKMRPFVLRTAGQFRPGPPPALTSAAYTRSYRETKAYGSAASSVRSPEQTDTALFWGLGRPDAQYNEGIRGIIASAGLNRIQAARAMALANLVTADAYIACFDAKYAYSAWRPYTAIRAGDTDGNPATIADPTWTPLVKTPNHPEYPANHACVTTSYAKIIDYLLGRRHFTLTVSGVPASTQTRSYTSSAQLITEIANARVWGGVHFRFSTTAGAAVGIAVARFDYRHALQPDRDDGRALS